MPAAERNPAAAIPMTDEHPFAPFVRILGRGRTGSRALTEAEAQTAFGMILDGQALPVQLGAFLMLLRFREETPEEIAGFVRAVRQRLTPPAGVTVDLDWSSYAGKRRQLPWFILSALLLAENGVRVFMHGADGHTPGRVYTRGTIERLGLPIAGSLSEAAAHLGARNFAYLPLRSFCPRLHELIELRPILGLRSPVHTLARLVNPFSAPYQIQGIFHPGYRPIHVGAAALLGQPHMALLKGEGGEIERKPNKACAVSSLHDGGESEENWPALIDDRAQPADEAMDIDRLAAVWRGEADDAYGAATVAGTAAPALRLLGRAASPGEADAQANALWRARDRKRLRAA
jgi:anthranilate phosphoribosyltransferase